MNKRREVLTVGDLRERLSDVEDDARVEIVLMNDGGAYDGIDGFSHTAFIDGEWKLYVEYDAPGLWGVK